MTITSQAGTIGFAIQDDGVKGGAVQTWYRHKALVASVAPVIQQEVAPPEISGPNIPTGAYKSGTFYAGRMAIQPRLEGDFGWLLLGSTGQVATAAHPTQTGVIQHVFTYADNLATFIPFMGFRRIIPGKDPLLTDDEGEIGIDCLISAVTFDFPQVGPLGVTFDVVGREWTLDDAPDLWTWADVPESYDSVPMVMKGTGITLPNWTPGGGTQLPITGARVTLANNTTSPQEERIIGSYNPDDFAVRQRSMIVEMTYKWENPDLCRLIANGNVGNLFAACIDFTDFHLTVETPCDINPGTVDYPWALEFDAPNMFWQMQPVQLMGDDIIMLQIVGTAIEPASGLPQDYMSITLNNGQAAYVMPTP